MRHASVALWDSRWLMCVEQSSWFMSKTIVLAKITMDLPCSQSSWLHDEMEAFEGLDMVDAEFGIPVSTGVYLGADYDWEILLHDWLWGPRGTLYNLRTCFGWVLAGHLKSPGPDQQHIPAAYLEKMTLQGSSLRSWIINKNLSSLQIKRTMGEHYKSSYFRAMTDPLFPFQRIQESRCWKKLGLRKYM